MQFFFFTKYESCDATVEKHCQRCTRHAEAAAKIVFVTDGSIEEVLPMKPRGVLFVFAVSIWLLSIHWLVWVCFGRSSSLEDSCRLLTTGNGMKMSSSCYFFVACEVRRMREIAHGQMLERRYIYNLEIWCGSVVWG